MINDQRQDWGALLRRAVLSALAAALLLYQLLPLQAKQLSVRAELGLPQTALAMTGFAAVFSGLCLIAQKRPTARAERWGIFTLCLILSAQSVLYHPEALYAAGTAVLTGLSLIYAIRGRSSAAAPDADPDRRPVFWALAVGIPAAAVFVFLSRWGIARVRGFSASTFDFGIFAQMFHKMKTTGLPLTTLERDGLLSHFAVHVSPIWYLLLPFWLIWPKPEVLPVLQAAILVSSVIPLWLLAKRLGFSPFGRFLACVVLLAHPALSGGTSYDIHENCFLTPLLLWLFWAAEGTHGTLTVLFAVLTCSVKEDAPVYVAIFGLYLLVRGLLDRKARDRLVGFALFCGALAWFLGAVLALRLWGEGTMDYRYMDLMDPAHPSLGSVILTVLLTPLRAIQVSCGEEKLLFALRFLGPLLFLPLLTRKQERYILLLPFLLYHLLTSYPYQYNLLFQYGFGTLAFAVYLALLNLRELLLQLRGRAWVRAGALIAAAAVGLYVSIGQVLPNARTYIERWSEYREGWEQVGEILDRIPTDVTVTSGTYLTQRLSDREAVYDLYYTSTEHLLESDYVVLEPLYETEFRRWASAEGAEDGKQQVRSMLEANGYRLVEAKDGWVEVWARDP